MSNVLEDAQNLQMTYHMLQTNQSEAAAWFSRVIDSVMEVIEEVGLFYFNSTWFVLMLNKCELININCIYTYVLLLLLRFMKPVVGLTTLSAYILFFSRYDSYKSHHSGNIYFATDFSCICLRRWNVRILRKFLSLLSGCCPPRL